MRYKSPLKLIDGGNFNISAIASNTAPYSDLIIDEIHLCKNTKEQIEAITKIVLDEEYIIKITNNLKELIDEEFNTIELTEERLKFIK